MATFRPANGGQLASGNVGGGRGRGTLRVTSPRQLALMQLNLAKFDEVTRAIGDGVFEALKGIIERAGANAPDSPYDPYPEGEGLPKQGGVLVYIGNKKTHGWSIRGDQPKKPRSARLATKQHSVVGLAGFGFPGRFAERGTIRTPAQPFLEPEFDRSTPAVPRDIAAVAKPKIGEGR